MNQQVIHDILLPSLELIRKDTKIKRFYFIPGILSVVFLSVLLVYQTVYTYVELLGKSDTLMQYLYKIFNLEYFIEIIVISAIFFVIYSIVIPIYDGALIRYIQQEHEHKQASRSESFGFGIFRFYAMFEFNNVFGMFKLMSVFNAFLFSLRFLGIEYFNVLALIFLIGFLFSIVINLFIAYIPYIIVLENTGVFEALGISTKITLLNIKTTLQLYIFMFFMNIKVVINFIVFLAFPLAIISIGSFLSSQVFTTIAFIIIGGLFLFLILVLGYLAAVLDIFTTSIWYRAYIIGRQKINDNDHH